MGIEGAELRRITERLKRDHEKGEQRKEAIAEGRVQDPLCKHVVSRKGVEQMRHMGGGYLPCGACGKMLHISGQRRWTESGEII